MLVEIEAVAVSADRSLSPHANGESIRTMRWLRRLPIDLYLIALLATLLLATLLPARGAGATVAGHASTIAVGLLFFLYGARLAPREAWTGARHWRLHLLVLLTTFGLFPLLVLAASVLRPAILPGPLYSGLLFLGVVPSTVQSAIAFTSMARGNVPATVFSATFSNLAGVIVTPVLAAVMLTGTGTGTSTGEVGLSAGSIAKIVITLLLPFALGQALRPWIGDLVKRHSRILGPIDRGSILIVVYTAFSAGIVAGIWRQVSPWRILALVAVLAALLAVVLLLTGFVAARLGFSREDRVTIAFCGSNKSIATGLPMAAVLFSPHTVAIVVLPLMLYHQLQLVVCAILARRWGAAAQAATPAEEPSGADLATGEPPRREESRLLPGR
jgi:sodium/bile acid cotransporter 7